MTQMLLPVRRALLSVSDKTGRRRARARARRAQHRDPLHRRHGEAAGRQRRCRCARSAATPGFPEIMDGRVKTLHPKIHGGLLGRRGIDEPSWQRTDRADRPARGESLSVRGDDRASRTAPTRRPSRTSTSAARRCCARPRRITPPSPSSVDPDGLREGPCTSWMPERRHHAGDAIAARGEGFRAHGALRHHGGELSRSAPTVSAAERFPQTLPLVFDKAQDLRYGENPHQRAAFYRDPAARGASIATARCCRARSCRSTTSPTRIRRSSACGSSTSPPASSSSTPIPAESP